jgi:putative redox protein
MAHATAHIGTTRYAVRIEASGHLIEADEPQGNGGTNTGPAPYDLLLASLGACTAITLRMYAERKQWEVRAIDVELQFMRNGDEERIRRKVRIDAALDETQRARFADIVERTPVTLTLKRGLAIATEFVAA